MLMPYSLWITEGLLHKEPHIIAPPIKACQKDGGREIFYLASIVGKV